MTTMLLQLEARRVTLGTAANCAPRLASCVYLASPSRSPAVAVPRLLLHARELAVPDDMGGEGGAARALEHGPLGQLLAAEGRAENGVPQRLSVTASHEEWALPPEKGARRGGERLEAVGEVDAPRALRRVLRVTATTPF